MKFNHEYKKLFSENRICSWAKLIQVLPVDMEEISHEFIDYDADGKYILPKKGSMLLLFFLKPCGNIFTTLKQYTQKKSIYYYNALGQKFDIVIAEEE